MTIAIIAGTYQPDRCGVAHYTAHLRTALAQQHLPSVVLTTHAAAQSLKDPGVIGAVQDWSLGQLLPLVQAVHRSQADVLHIQHAAGTYGFDRALFLLPLLLRLSGWQRPIVSTIHEYGWWEWQTTWFPAHLLEWLKTAGQQRRWWDREDGFLLTLSDAIITTNAPATEVILQRLPHLQTRVQQIPIGANVEVAPVDRALARQQIRQHCGWSEDSQVIAFFGFLHPVKGLETLLSAFQQVIKAHPQAKLLLVGGVESLALPGEQATRYWNQLEAQIANLGLTNAVHMTGYVEAAIASRYLSGADVGVLPFNHGVTLKSGSLLALMAHGLPVVATDPLNGRRELDETRVYPVLPRNVEALTVALQRMLIDESLRSRLAQAGQRFSRQFSWETIGAAHAAIYRQVQPSQPQTSESAV